MMRLVLAALLVVPAVAKADVAACRPGATVEVATDFGNRTGHVLGAATADGLCLVWVRGLLTDREEWVPIDRVRPAGPAHIFSSPGAPAVENAPCSVGDAVEIEWQGQWYPGRAVHGPLSDGTCLVTYDGYDSSWDEWVAPHRLRAAGTGGFEAGSGLCVPGWPVRVEWEGRWWAGHVLDGPAADGTCYITYDGYDAAWDEWVTPGRLAPAT